MSKHDQAKNFSRAASEDAEVRDLIQAAGPRPAPPAEELAALRAVAKERWREAARIERERARFRRATTVAALAASVLMAVAIGWWFRPDFGTGTPVTIATLELLRGEVRADGAAAGTGSALARGTVVETGAGSVAALSLSGAQSVRLDRDTRVRLTSDSSLELERGAVYVDTHHATPGTGLEVATPFGVVRDVGTQFLVRLGARGDERLSVRVREGEIVLERDSGSHAARAGEELTLRPGSDAVETRPIEHHGAAWEWVQSAAPAMEIEGVSLSEYLDWVSRETGRELRYADEALARSAKTIILSGSIDDLTPEESLSILPGSGLGHRVENGWLLIEPPAGPARNR